MRKARFTKHQIIAGLKSAEAWSTSFQPYPMFGEKADDLTSPQKVPNLLPVD